MRDILVIKDPEVAKLLADKTRRDILRLLSIRELSPCQIAKVLNKNVSSIAHHLRRLEEAGLVELCGTRVKGNVVEKYYRAAARRFIVSFSLWEARSGAPAAEWLNDVVYSVVKALPSFGFEVRGSEEAVAERIKTLLVRRQLALERVAARQREPVPNACALSVLLEVVSLMMLMRDEEFLGALEWLRGAIVEGERGGRR